MGLKAFSNMGQKGLVDCKLKDYLNFVYYPLRLSSRPLYNRDESTPGFMFDGGAWVKI